MPLLTINQRKYPVSSGITILDALSSLGIFHDAPCGGMGKCKKCTVSALGALSPVSTAEADLPNGMRLACVARIEGDVTLTLSDELAAEIETGGLTRMLPPDRGDGYAIACDIGTTTVVCHLERLSDGSRLASLGELNRQRPYGADVISRISASLKEESFVAQHRAIVEEIEEMSLSLLRKHNLSPGDCRLVTIAGNTTMELLFAGVSPAPLAELPFTSPTLFGYDIPSPFTTLSPERVFLFPCAESFVGGDITAAVLAAGFFCKDTPSLLLDIGTNGEMALGNKDRLTCAAAAAGPAFEGADISCGMSSLTGAIDTVSFNGKLHFTTIGNAPAIGICGSGLIDALAVLLEMGAVDESGRLLPPDECEAEAEPYITEEDDGVVFHFYPSDVVITAGDIRKLQLATAAIRAGLETLLDDAGFSAADLDQLYIAGGFGSHIRLSSAVRIGMVPKDLFDKCIFMGNGAGEGASMVARSSHAEVETQSIHKKFEYLDLSTSPVWQDLYIEYMMFPEE
ncbi:MAG: DUF4445 domain-containing protein [Clostridia bacterium]|nr:DUF4445 domain-containing protein [Clostridia bacterium]